MSGTHPLLPSKVNEGIFWVTMGLAVLAWGFLGVINILATNILNVRRPSYSAPWHNISVYNGQHQLLFLFHVLSHRQEAS